MIQLHLNWIDTIQLCSLVDHWIFISVMILYRYLHVMLQSINYQVYMWFIKSFISLFIHMTYTFSIYVRVQTDILPVTYISKSSKYTFISVDVLCVCKWGAKWQSYNVACITCDPRIIISLQWSSDPNSHSMSVKDMNRQNKASLSMWCQLKTAWI